MKLRFRRYLKLTYVFPIIVVVLAITARLLPGPRTIDDSYITFRYARNILAGNGFTYNPGEHVLGTTTPLYTILLTIIASLNGGAQAPFPQIALLVNALADGVTCLLLLFLGKRFNSPLAGAAAGLAWAVAPFSVTFAIGGLETSVYILLLVGLMGAYLGGKRVLTAFLGALALLTRPDALILLGPLGVDWLWSLTRNIRGKTHNNASVQNAKPNSVRNEILAFIVPTLTWILFSTCYFGSPLPHSIAAKSLAYRLPSDAAFIRLLQHYATPFMDNLTFGVPAIVVGLFLYPTLYLIGAWYAFRSNPRIWPFVVYPWLYFAAFSIANPLIFRWYLTPPLPAYILFILIGLERLIRSLRAKKSSTTSSARIDGVIIPVFIVLLPCLLMLRDWRWKPDHGIQRPAPEMAWYQLELLYRQAADSLWNDLYTQNPTPVLAAGDVGVLGYFTGATILDTVGLNSPISTQYYPLPEALYITNYAIPPDLILDQQPDFIVIMEVYGRAGLLKDAVFQQEYRLREKIPTDIYTSDGMLIFERLKK